MKTMDEMYKYSQFKRFYLIMDNSPIHGKKGKLGQLIGNRGYNCVYLPPYFPGLNSIEQSQVAIQMQSVRGYIRSEKQNF